MYKLVMVLTAGLLALSIMTTASATHHYSQYQYRTIYSPGCGPIKITQIAGPAVMSLAARLTSSGKISGYVIMLDTNKLSFRQLFLLMGEHGCFRHQYQKYCK